MNTRIKTLENLINKAREDYYNNQPTLTDSQYDALIDELTTLASDNPAITKVGAPLSLTKEWKKVKHEIAVGSLEKVNTEIEFDDWFTKLKADSKNKELFVTQKLDGISIVLYYNEGEIVSAVTRGSGLEGFDILSNVKQMNGFISNIRDFTGSIRGEILLSKKSLKENFPDKTSCRNVASGIAQKFSGENCNKLHLLMYQVVGIDFETEEKQFDWLKKQKFNTPNYWVFQKTNQVNDFINSYSTEREKYDFDLDGLVVRLNNIPIQLEQGFLHMRPKGAVAYKFKNVAKQGEIEKIVWQVGGSGRLTPVAYFKEEIELQGAKVTKASLYNLDYIKALGINIGSIVAVVRANEVIPRVEKVIDKQDFSYKEIENCPTCNSKVKISGEYLVCDNINCIDQVSGRIKNWIKGLNILEFGDTLIEKLVQFNKVKSIPDLYKLSVADLESIDRMGLKSATKALDNLHSKKTITLDEFLGNLSFPGIGKLSIKSMMSELNSLDDFMNVSSPEVFSNIHGVGEVKAEALFNSLNNQKSMIESLLNHVTIAKPAIGVLTNKTIVFTGTMQTKRSVLENLAEKNGAVIKSSVNKATDYLVINELNSNSSKAVSARKFGTKLISEKDFLELVK